MFDLYSGSHQTDGIIALTQVPLQQQQLDQLGRQLAILGFHLQAKGNTVQCTDRLTDQVFSTQGENAYYNITLAALMAALNRIEFG